MTIHCSQTRRKSGPTNCSGLWMLPRESSAAHENSTVAWRDLCTTGWTSHSVPRSSCVYCFSCIYTAWHRSISPSYVYRLPTPLPAPICALPLEVSRTTEFSSVQHEKLYQLTFSSALWKRSYSGVVFSALETICLMFNGLYKLTYLLTLHYNTSAENRQHSCCRWFFEIRNQ